MSTGAGVDNDAGIGGRLTWRALPLVGLDANVAWYPHGFPWESAAPVSAYRLEGLFGATVGPTLDRIRPFAKAAAGFVRVGAASEPVACIAIFPPPLLCILAAGTTLPAIEIGGGAELDVTSSAFIRADIGARVLQYPGPALDTDFQVRDADYWQRSLRFTIGAGLRF